MANPMLTQIAQMLAPIFGIKPADGQAAILKTVEFVDRLEMRLADLAARLETVQQTLDDMRWQTKSEDVALAEAVDLAIRAGADRELINA